VDTTRALKLVPITKLALSLANFDDWKMSVWLHLSYHNVDCFLRDLNEPLVVEGNNGLCLGCQDERRRRLLAYSIVYTSCKEVIPYAENWLGMKLRRDDDQLDPKPLWEMMMGYHRARYPTAY
ncbi:hypothetical protein B0T20DRAFT_321707, partial [Sordaria brevicollis]